MSDVLTLAESSAGPWFARHLPPLHAVLGDSIARDAKFRSRFSHHDFMQLGTGGATWRSTELKLADHLQAWRQEATARSRRLGTAVVWHSGNDVYHRSTGIPHYDEETVCRSGERVRHHRQPAAGGGGSSSARAAATPPRGDGPRRDVEPPLGAHGSLSY